MNNLSRDQKCLAVFDGVEDIDDLIDMIQTIKAGPAMVKVMFDIMKFANDAKESDKPLYTRIAAFGNADLGNGKIEEYTFPVVSLWAGVNNANPLDRCFKLATALVAIAKLGDENKVAKEIAAEALKV